MTERTYKKDLKVITSVRLAVSPATCLTSCLAVCLTTCLAVCLTTCLAVCPATFSTLCPTLHPPTCISVFNNFLMVSQAPCTSVVAVVCGRGWV